MRQILTPDDLKKTDPIDPGWYPAEITKYEEAVVKGTDDKPSDGSMNAIFYFTILDGPPNVKGRELRRYLNEKSLHWGKNMYAAIGLPKNAAGGYDLSTEIFEKFVGRKCNIYVLKNKQTGFDSIEDFKPLS